MSGFWGAHRGVQGRGWGRGSVREGPGAPRYLQQPVAAAVEGGDDGRVDVAAIEALGGQHRLGDPATSMRTPKQTLGGSPYPVRTAYPSMGDPRLSAASLEEPDTLKLLP